MPRVHELANVDLNLVRVLGALLEERHLTRAGKRLGMSQSATSHSLRRLRRVFGDPLFVRTARGLAPTARGLDLAVPVREALLALGRCFQEAEAFVPASAARSFSLATSDYGSFVLAPRLIERVGRDAPGVDLWIRAVGAPFEDQLLRGEADVAVVPARKRELPAGVRSRRLYRERFLCLVREDHPRVTKGIDLAAWTSMRHVLIAPNGTPGGVVDDTLAQLGARRRVAVAVPHFLLAPHVIAQSDLVVTTGARVAEAFTKVLPLRALEPPREAPELRRSDVLARTRPSRRRAAVVSRGREGGRGAWLTARSTAARDFSIRPAHFPRLAPSSHPEDDDVTNDAADRKRRAGPGPARGGRNHLYGAGAAPPDGAESALLPHARLLGGQ